MKVVSFLASDNVMLSGILYESHTNSIIISVHGMKNNAINPISNAIGELAVQKGISLLSFNTRGHDLVSYIETMENGKKIKKLGGASFEDVLEAYEDIKGAIDFVSSLGYQTIYLLGHSLGCTKIVYTYSKMKKNNELSIVNKIKGILLLSLVDIPNIQKFYLGIHYDDMLNLAEAKEKTGNLEELMPKNTFIHPISVKTYLRYFRDNSEIDIADYSSTSLDKLNTITSPLLMIWGTEKEMILQTPSKLEKILKDKITSTPLTVEFIEGANHSYVGKEDLLAKEVINFIKNL